MTTWCPLTLVFSLQTFWKVGSCLLYTPPLSNKMPLILWSSLTLHTSCHVQPCWWLCASWACWSLVQLCPYLSCTKESKTGHNSLSVASYVPNRGEELLHWLGGYTPANHLNVHLAFLAGKLKQTLISFYQVALLVFPSLADWTVCIMCKSKFLLWPQLLNDSIWISCLFGFKWLWGHYWMANGTSEVKKKRQHKNTWIVKPTRKCKTICTP